MGKILMAGDVKLSGSGSIEALTGPGHTVVHARGGREALQLHGSEKADVIIVPLHMPDMGAHDLCSTIRNDKGMRGVSIIIVHPDTGDGRQQAEHCRANVTLAEPVPVERLALEAKRLITIARRQTFQVITHMGPPGEEFGHAVCATLNISVTGMLVETKKVFEQGQRVQCSFFLPGQKRVVAQGEVARITERPNGFYHYGIKFDPLPQWVRSDIESFIHSRS